jgi:selenide,water dikinase
MTASPVAPLRLTDLTDCGGCAAKLGADLLADALAGLGTDAPPDLIVGLDPADDAAAYLVAPDLAILGTVDFFPPLVDDPETYGAIAAANAVSDIFAMGGRVLFALSVASLPEDLPREAIAAILAGASATVRAAGGTLAGGHTIKDPEPTFGLAVIGAAHPDRLLRKGGARPGDVLLLTKPLGTGLLVSGARAGRAADGAPAAGADGAARAGRTSPVDLDGAIASMRRLNRAASEIFVAHGLAGATDVTGFGLLGHGWEMARAASAPHGRPGASGPAVRFVFDAIALPALPGALAIAATGAETGGAAHNRRFVAPALTMGPDVTPAVVALARDPQTSGGLLAAVPADRLAAVTTALDAAGEPWWQVGRVESAGTPGIALV